MTKETEALVKYAIDRVLSELGVAYKNFPDFRSAHEGVAIVQEEFEEFKDAAFWPHKQVAAGTEEDEAIQLAAMAVRYLVDVCYKEDTPR